MEFDLQAYSQAAVQGIPLLFVVFGLVWWYGKAFSWKGRTQFISSLITGAIIGLLYMVAILRPPIDPDWWPVFVYWFSAVFYGIGLGIFASLFYESGKEILVKVLQNVLEK